MSLISRAGIALLLGSVEVLSAQPGGQKNPLAELSASIRELTSRVSPAVVEVIVTGYGAPDDDNGRTSNQISRQNSSGSGVLVDPAGYIMTNAHVVQGAINLKVLIGSVTASGEADSHKFQNAHTFDAKVLGVDHDSDLALLRIDETGLPWLRFGDSDTLSQGDLVLAIGSPMRLHNSLSMGVVSAPARAVADDNSILYIQTDASINPGDSGGALVSTDGRLVGLNTFIMTKSGGNEGIGFAIPSDVVENVYKQLRQTGVVSRGSLGVSVQDITDSLARGLSLPLQEGVMISDLDREGPGASAGLQRRDVILTLDEKPITTARQFDDAIYRHQVGERVNIAIRRGPERFSLVAGIRGHSAKLDSLSSLVSPAKNLVSRLGIFCVEIDEQVSAMMPELRKGYGVLVAARSPEGQVQFVDLRPGDVIHTLNNLPIALLDTFRTKINEFQHGDAVALQVEREGRFKYVAFDIE